MLNRRLQIILIGQFTLAKMDEFKQHIDQLLPGSKSGRMDDHGIAAST